MSMSVEGVVAMQACARIGATHSVVFGGFSAQSLRDRIEGAGAVMVDHRRRAGARRQAVAAEGHRRRGASRWAAASRSRTSSSTGAPAARSPGTAARDRWLHDEMQAPGRHLRARMGRRRAPAVPALHLAARPASPRACSTRPAATCCMRRADDEVDLRPEGRRRLLVHRRHRLGHRPHLHRLRPAGARRHRGGVRRRAHLPRRGPLLEDDPGPQGQRVLHRADGDPLADQGGRGQRRGAPRPLRPVAACASSARSASRSTRPPGSGTTSTSAAAAARSSTPSGRPRPAAT